MIIRHFRLWWELASFEDRRDLVKRWFDLVIVDDKSLSASELASRIGFEDLPISLVYELSQDKIFIERQKFLEDL